MNADSLLYLMPYLISAAISAGVGIYSWRRRAVIGAQEFAVVALAQSSWTLAYVFELASNSLEAMIFWDNTQFIGLLIAPSAFLVFALQYPERKLPRPARTWGLLAIVPVTSLVVVFTDNLHRLIRPEAWIVAGDSFSVLGYDFTLAFLIMSIYAFGLSLVGVIVLINKYLQRRLLYRSQIGMIMAAVAIPIVGGVMTLIGITPLLYRDITPLTFALSNLLIAWGLFRFRMFDLVPIARDAVIESMSDAVVVFDAQDRVIDLNRAAQETLGLKASGVIGLPAIEVYAEWSHMVEHFQGIDEAHTMISLMVEGENEHYDLRLSSLKGRGGLPRGRVMVVRNITALIRAEEEIEKYTQQLEAANEHLKLLSQAKDEFVSNVSHELRTPITNLRLYLDLVSQRPEKSDLYFEVLMRETDRLENMIQGLLTLSRFDQDRLELNLESVDLNALIEEYVKDRVAMAKHRGLELKLDLISAKPLVNADRNLLGQALSILLTNALNYTPQGGEVIVCTQTDSSDGRQWAGVCVSDTGPGIPPEELTQLFTRFFRGVVGRQSDVPGTGLGLAIVSEIVERHQGRVEVQSEGVAGEGATFRVWLPVEK